MAILLGISARDFLFKYFVGSFVKTVNDEKEYSQNKTDFIHTFC